MVEEGFCPSCGTWGLVVEEVGWCEACITLHRPDNSVCRRCGALFPSNKRGYYCSTCKELNWLEKHADELEELLSQGHSLRRAKAIVATNIRPKCIVCQGEIRGGRPNALFCGKTDECVKARRFYLRLKSRGATTEVAVSLMGGIYDHSN